MLLPIVRLSQTDTIRLIPSGRLKPPALEPLAASDQALEDLAILESATNRRIQAQQEGLSALDPRELVFGRPNQSFINAAFTHTRPGGSRFNDEDRGAWYCAFEVETGLSEVAYHLTRELEAIGRFENVTDYAELIADFIGPFHDLRMSALGPGDPSISACLDSDPSVGYPAGQALARRLRSEDDSSGIVYPSVRHRGGTCLVAFRPDLVQNLRQGDLWRLAWQGNRVPAVQRLGGD